MTSPPRSPSAEPHEITADELLAGDLTAALLQEQLGPDDVLPPALAARITAAGEALVRAEAVPPIAPASASPWTSRTTRALLTWSGWLAAAALLVFVVRSDRPGAAVRQPATILADARAALLDSLLATPGVERRRWTPTTDSTAATVSGELLWDPVSQRGIMRFTGLAANDPQVWQYQLWIFDAARDERFPVDGGVFDVSGGPGEQLVPIRARLPVGEATLFAVTVEAPGGVVVSGRERIAVTAAL